MSGFRAFFILLLLLGLSGCLAASQNFPVGSPLWLKANPALTHLELVIAAQKNHKIRVGVLDAGLDYNVPELEPHLHLLATPAETGRGYGVGWDVIGKDYFPNYQALDPNTGEDASELMSLRDHGTHVSQLVTLKDPAIGIIPVRVIPVESMEGDNDLRVDNRAAFDALVARRCLKSIESGIEFAVSQGASIINMSLGLGLDELTADNKRAIIEEIRSGIQKRIEGEWKNVLMVVAAGNETSNLERPTQSIPATLEAPDMIAVGALKNKQWIAAYSNYGRFVDLWVHGSDINSRVAGGTREKMSGTSMATPIVAHVAAQLRILLPWATPGQIRALLLNTADLLTLPTEIEDNPNEAGPRRPVRFMNIKKAKAVAKAIGDGTEASEKWFKAPFPHGATP